MIVLIPIIVAIIGLLMWILSSNPIIKDMGRGLFFIGAFVAVFRSSAETLNLLR